MTHPDNAKDVELRTSRRFPASPEEVFDAYCRR